MKNNISEVEVQIIKPKSGLIGFASLVINNELYISSIGIHQKLSKDDYRLTYPTKALSNGQLMQIVHPINKRLSKLIEKAIFNKLNEVMQINHDRYSGTNNTNN